MMLGFFYPELFWLIIGVLLLLLEMALPGFILFFFGAGALITAAAVWIAGPDSLLVIYQLLLFLCSSLILLVVFRGVIMRKFFTPPEVDAEARAAEGSEDVIHAKPGEVGMVTLAIRPPAEGQIKFGGTFWRATADGVLEAGETVEIVRQCDLVIHVKKIDRKEGAK